MGWWWGLDERGSGGNGNSQGDGAGRGSDDLGLRPARSGSKALPLPARAVVTVIQFSVPGSQDDSGRAVMVT
jgi:hypothetical protein